MTSPKHIRRKIRYPRLTTVPGERAWLLPLASGILLILSFPKFGWGLFAWAAFVPLLRAIGGSRPGEAMRRGFITGFVFNVGILYWVAYVVVHYGYMPLYMGIGATVLLSCYLAFYFALFAAGTAWFEQRGIPPILSAPVLFTCLEYAKSHLLTGFPWENLAYSQYLSIRLIQIADVTGIYGLTFLIVLVNVALSDLVGQFPSSGLGKPSLRRAFLVETSLVALLVFGVILYGSVRLHQIDSSLQGAKGMTVALIQGNIEQDIKWNPLYQRDTLAVYRSLSLAAAEAEPDLIIWPETATPFYFQDVDDLQREILDIARRSGAMLLFGSPSYQKETSGLTFYNSAFVLSPRGGIEGRYDKVHLVPFGEYVPLRKLFPFMSKIVVGIGDFGSGRGYEPLTLPGCRAGILICYEAIFPAAARTYRRAGAELLVNITNDAWFGRTSAPFQHLSMTAFRAVENRLFVARAANTGISAIIDPAGRITSRTEIFERAVLTGKVKFIGVETFYTACGDVFVYLCLSVLICALVILYGERRRTHA
ncbi:MAG: apolipoprotein N-acyltransferase [Deltaproteobacteria bacterium]|nr:apolipoprotein N-acyltransferase [Deltaproteobacteria bacterium]